jgi:tRNA A37 threonylcarbamoyladenosine modification protein TsaB
MSLCLFIDGSVCGMALALAPLTDPGAPALWQTVSEHHRGAQKISLLIEEGLSSLGKSNSDIQYMVVSTGPGSFTGIKVALAWAYGFFAAHYPRVKIYGCSSLAEVLPALDTQADKSNILFFPSTRTFGFLCRKDEQTQQAVFELVNLLEKQGQERVQEFLNNPRCVFTYVEPWQELVNLFPSQSYNGLPLAHVAQLALEGLVAKAKSLPPSEFSLEVPQPMYLRKTSVEEKLSRKENSHDPQNHP